MHNTKTTTSRGLNNNPSGKPYCCNISCDADAEFRITPVGAHFESSTDSCRRCLGEMMMDSPTGNWNIEAVTQ